MKTHLITMNPLLVPGILLLLLPLAALAEDPISRPKSPEDTPTIGSEWDVTDDTELMDLPLSPKDAPGGFSALNLLNAVTDNPQNTRSAVAEGTRVKVTDAAAGIAASGPEDFHALNMEVANKEVTKLEKRIRRVGDPSWFRVVLLEGKNKGRHGWLPARVLAKKRIVVNLDRQVIELFHGAEVIAVMDCITGRSGKETKPGIYHILRKERDYTSKKYNAPMPFSLFFDNDGKAIHGTQYATLRSYLQAYITGSVGSHGCVGLTLSDAERVYSWARERTVVEVVEK